MNTEIRQPSPDRQKEYQKRRIEQNQETYHAFVTQVKNFLEGGSAIDRKMLAEGEEAARFLSYNDEDGMISEKQTLHEVLRQSPLSQDAVERMFREDKKLYDAYSCIRGRADFMRGTYGDMSETVPLAIEREMIAVQVEQLQKFIPLWEEMRSRPDKTEDPDNKMASFIAESRARCAEVMKKANPYILADMSVAIIHSDEYVRLRRMFIEVGGIGERELTLMGESASMLVRKLLTDIHKDEYTSELEKFSEEDVGAPDLQKRNEFVQSSSAIDNEFKTW